MSRGHDDVHEPERTIGLDVEHERLRRVVVQLDEEDPDAAVARMQSETLPLLDELQQHTVALAALQKKLARERGDAVTGDIRSAESTMQWLGLIALLVGAAFAWVLTRSVTVPLDRAVQLSRRVAVPIADIPKHTSKRQLTYPGMHGYRGRRLRECPR